MPPKANKGKGSINGTNKGAKPAAKSSISMKGKGGKGGKGGAPAPKVSGNGGKGALSSMFDSLDAKRKAAGDAKASKNTRPQKAKRVADVASKQKDKRADAVKAKREKKVFYWSTRACEDPFNVSVSLYSQAFTLGEGSTAYCGGLRC